MKMLTLKKMKHYEYKCSVCDGIEYKPSVFRALVTDILKSSDGWVKWGYSFRLHSPSSPEPSSTHPIIHIKLASDRFISDHGTSFNGMSIANCQTSEIHINYERWMSGAKKTNPQDPTRIRMSLNEYRAYVIRHEVGHILLGCTAEDHKTECVDGVAPIMMQQTRGVGDDCAPNTTPLEVDVPAD